MAEDTQGDAPHGPGGASLPPPLPAVEPAGSDLFADAAPAPAPWPVGPGEPPAHQPWLSPGRVRALAVLVVAVGAGLVMNGLLERLEEPETTPVTTPVTTAPTTAPTTSAPTTGAPDSSGTATSDPSGSSTSDPATSETTEPPDSSTTSSGDPTSTTSEPPTTVDPA